MALDSPRCRKCRHLHHEARPQAHSVAEGGRASFLWDVADCPQIYWKSGKQETLPPLCRYRNQPDCCATGAERHRESAVAVAGSRGFGCQTVLRYARSQWPGGGEAFISGTRSSGQQADDTSDIGMDVRKASRMCRASEGRRFWFVARRSSSTMRRPRAPKRSLLRHPENAEAYLPKALLPYPTRRIPRLALPRLESVQRRSAIRRRYPGGMLNSRDVTPAEGSPPALAGLSVLILMSSIIIRREEVCFRLGCMQRKIFWATFTILSGG
jgi:hypothetical protein